MHCRFAGTKKSGRNNEVTVFFSGGGRVGVHCNSFYFCPRERWVKKLSRLGYLLLYLVLACFCCCITFSLVLFVFVVLCHCFCLFVSLFFFHLTVIFCWNNVTLLNESYIQFLKLSPQRRGVSLYCGWLSTAMTVWELRPGLLICVRSCDCQCTGTASCRRFNCITNQQNKKCIILKPGISKTSCCKIGPQCKMLC